MSLQRLEKAVVSQGDTDRDAQEIKEEWSAMSGCLKVSRIKNLWSAMSGCLKVGRSQNLTYKHK